MSYVRYKTFWQKRIMRYARLCIAMCLSMLTEGKWWTREELLAAAGRDVLTPNFEAEFARIEGHLLALL